MRGTLHYFVYIQEPQCDTMRDLAKLALDTATSLGASYADARYMGIRRQFINCEDERLSSAFESDGVGMGIRVICDGAWGFGSTNNLTNEGITIACKQACQLAYAMSGMVKKKVILAPEPPHCIIFNGPCEIDPFSIPINDKAELLIGINKRLLSQQQITRATSYMRFQHEHKLILTSEGSDLESFVNISTCGYTATAVDANDAQTRSYEAIPRSAGYENIIGAQLMDNAERVAAEAREHLMAPNCDDGPTDLILDPFNLSLTMHESVGHATELDRILGYEESLAGRSFATLDKLGKLQYGSPLVNFVADNTLPGGLASAGFDDDGVPAQKYHIIKDGIYSNVSMSREVAAEVGRDRSLGSCRADHWSSIPIVRIPNLSLSAGKTPLSLDELIADTQDGIYIEGMGSFSIDQMRQNFQFGGDAFWRIKNGKRVGMLKNVTYQSITEKFWNSCDAICDQRFWIPNGVMNCGKGDPMQIARMTHGAAPARFRQITVRRAR